MNLFSQIGILLRKELVLELRTGYAISGILLYVLSTVFIVYSAFFQGVNNAMMWVTLFWIIMLFASINAIVKSFVQENGNRQLYYYSLLDPLAVIISKMVYNISLLFLLSLLTWAALAFMVGNQIEEFSAFLLALFLGSVGFSILFTFVAAISSKADNNSTLLAILSFPLVIPILMTLIKLSVGATGMLEDTGVGKDIGILVAIDLVLAGLTLVLYPFLWRD
ncbi:MAG TPA: heme exporter protein CcmB [Haliscomenobacter sp.]|uniref:Cytochrome c-type biogenesis protein CcmB n=1 Tax=Haliscomenobacter hydrossis (strain ATCC 27775 / DSM 1100 / LMG 10767 / O) TaxID=760192 RepID=F4L699_HALH1|nr:MULTISPECIES: heme exporter protein CcmB [Haliscomenobacter]AEE54117.1 cytochrome c-type biogenesis protein CcmB [Haliscomenobacter hydrossis DSM 1100]MBK9488688.1 heme exporter protein CcmB [Haliscomenobacter sp.]HOY15938.1 heme exporter protein CcmB [Haliscomenobacter sp.]HPH17252.1 heme exporter protein CcmB [Haliscomenobacter sp.]